QMGETPASHCGHAGAHLLFDCARLWPHYSTVARNPASRDSGGPESPRHAPDPGPKRVVARQLGCRQATARRLPARIAAMGMALSQEALPANVVAIQGESGIDLDVHSRWSAADCH